MPIDPNRPAQRDPIDALFARVADLERLLERQGLGPLPTMPTVPRVVRGVLGTGTSILAGSGFTVSTIPGTGRRVTFDVPFAGPVAPVVTVIGDGLNSDRQPILGALPGDWANDGTGFAFRIVDQSLNDYVLDRAAFVVYPA